MGSTPREYYHCMSKARGKLLTLRRIRMYKTRFKSWGVKKYGVDSTTKSIDRKVRLRLAQHGISGVGGGRELFDPIELQKGSQETEIDEHAELSLTESSNLALTYPIRTSSSMLLNTPSSSNTSSHPSTANTPNHSRVTSRPSSSDRASIMTPESSGSSEGYCVPPPPSSGSDRVSTIRQDLLRNTPEVETFAPRPRRPSEIPRSVPQSWGQIVHNEDGAIADQIVDEVMGYSSPSTFSIPAPNETFRSLMTAPANGSSYQSDALRQRLVGKRGMDPNWNLASPQPETWTSLCLWINILLGQERASEAEEAMQSAAMIYQRLVEDKNDQILSILNLVVAILFLHRKKALAAELLSQAQIAASIYLKETDPIMVSIRFMIAMALQRSKNCGIRILQLRQVADQMRETWGENHRYCITADYQLAWRLALESDLLLEALSMLRQIQSRSERLFDPLHMQTVALITAQARVLGRLGHHFEAQATMSEALCRIERWDIKEDYPYYVEAKRRHKKFSEELTRVRSR
jgi:hypothetical protein